MSEESDIEISDDPLFLIKLPIWLEAEALTNAKYIPISTGFRVQFDPEKEIFLPNWLRESIHSTYKESDESQVPKSYRSDHLTEDESSRNPQYFTCKKHRKHGFQRSLVVDHPNFKPSSGFPLVPKLIQIGTLSLGSSKVLSKSSLPKHFNKALPKTRAWKLSPDKGVDVSSVSPGQSCTVSPDRPFSGSYKFILECDIPTDRPIKE